LRAAGGLLRTAFLSFAMGTPIQWVVRINDGLSPDRHYFGFV
jgi:hypothetical protein